MDWHMSGGHLGMHGLAHVWHMEGVTVLIIVVIFSVRLSAWHVKCMFRYVHASG